MRILQSAGLTDIGRKRKQNEDALFLDDKSCLYIVADGMGGHQSGEVASRLAIQSVVDWLNTDRPQPDASASSDTVAEEVFDPDQTQTITEGRETVTDEALSSLANRLREGMLHANRDVWDVSHKKENYRGMGTTLSAVLFDEETVIVGNVGDSPIYLVHNREIETVSVIHTVMAEEASRNPEGAKRLGPAFHHMLTRAIGINATVKPDLCELQVFRNDILIIASDGLTDKVTAEEICSAVTDHEPEQACQALVDLANERGGEDNITVIVIKVLSGKPNKGIFGVFSAFFKKMFG